jgi:NAD(P)H dehydrogenase (quinone)
MIAVTCPAGHIAAILVPRLLRRGHPVRALCRSWAGVESLVSAGVQVRHGDLCRREDLEPFLAGAQAAFLVVPLASEPGDEAAMGHVLAEAFGAAPTPHIVFVSLLGCDAAGAQGPVPTSIAVKSDIEQMLADLGTDFTFLRSGFLMENLSYLRRDLESGRMPLPVPVAQPLPAVSVHDLAQAALHVLARGPEGAERIPVLAPELLTPETMAAELAEAFGHPIAAEEITPADYAHRLMAAGVPPARAAHVAHVARHLSRIGGDERALDFRRDAREMLWGPAAVEPTHFHDFARTLADASLPSVRGMMQGS